MEFELDAAEMARSAASAAAAAAASAAASAPAAASVRAAVARAARVGGVFGGARRGRRRGMMGVDPPSMCRTRTRGGTLREPPSSRGKTKTPPIGTPSIGARR